MELELEPPSLFWVALYSEGAMMTPAPETITKKQKRRSITVTVTDITENKEKHNRWPLSENLDWTGVKLFV